MFTFIVSLVTLIAGAMMLLLLGQEIREHGLRPEPGDRVADIFLLIGFSCTLVSGAHNVWVLIS
jgi:preprotein translocase subunit SecY